MVAMCIYHSFVKYYMINGDKLIKIHYSKVAHSESFCHIIYAVYKASLNPSLLVEHISSGKWIILCLVSHFKFNVAMFINIIKVIMY